VGASHALRRVVLSCGRPAVQGKGAATGRGRTGGVGRAGGQCGDRGSLARCPKSGRRGGAGGAGTKLGLKGNPWRCGPTRAHTRSVLSLPLILWLKASPGSVAARRPAKRALGRCLAGRGRGRAWLAGWGVLSALAAPSKTGARAVETGCCGKAGRGAGGRPGEGTFWRRGGPPRVPARRAAAPGGPALPHIIQNAWKLRGCAGDKGRVQLQEPKKCAAAKRARAAVDNTAQSNWRSPDAPSTNAVVPIR
jgi:hypothetical protein